MKRYDATITVFSFLMLGVGQAQTPCPPTQLRVDGAPPEATTCPSAPAGYYSTNFDLTENPLSEGGKWRRASNAWTNVQTAGGVAFGTNGVTDGYDDSYAILSGFGPDYAAEAVVFRDASLSADVTHEVELLLRMSDDANGVRGYECLFSWNGGLQIMRWNGRPGDFTELPVANARSLGRPLMTGDIIRGTINGNTIRIYINGVEMGRAVDSTFSTGQPGIGFFIRPRGHQRLLGLSSYTVTSP